MDWKKIIKKLLFPPPLFLWLFAPASLAMLLLSVAACESTDPVSIVSYACSFCALVLVCLRVPEIILFGKRLRRENRYWIRYASDARLRIILSLGSAFAFNAAYAAFQLGLGLLHHSAWFYSMAGYYFLLGIMRLMLAKYAYSHIPGRRPETEWRIYRLCGILLFMMTFVLTVFVLYFILRIREFRHHEITTIAMAVYTFSSLTLSISGAVRYRKYASPAYSAAKAISLASAIVSVLTLENAMLTAFSQGEIDLFRRIMLGATGASVFFAVQGIAVYMIRSAGRNIRALRHMHQADAHKNRS